MLRQQHLPWLSAIGSPECLVCGRAYIHAHDNAYVFAQAQPVGFPQVCFRRRLHRARSRRSRAVRITFAELRLVPTLLLNTTRSHAKSAVCTTHC